MRPHNVGDVNVDSFGLSLHGLCFAKFFCSFRYKFSTRFDEGGCLDGVGAHKVRSRDGAIGS